MIGDWRLAIGDCRDLLIGDAHPPIGLHQSSIINQTINPQITNQHSQIHHSFVVRPAFVFPQQIPFVRRLVGRND
jgi:hypothetical protein